MSYIRDLFNGLNKNTIPTSEQIEEFTSMDILEMRDYSIEKRSEMLECGRTILIACKASLFQEDLPEESLKEITEYLEKMLFLSDSSAINLRISDMLITSLEKRKLIKAKQQDGKLIPDFLEWPPDHVNHAFDRLKERRKGVPPAGSRFSQFAGLVFGLLALAGIPLLFLHPGIREVFTDSNVYNALIAVGVIISLISFFIGGFGLAAVILVLFAVIVTLFKIFLSLPILAYILCTLVLAILAIFGFMTFFAEIPYLKPEYKKDRAKKLAAVRHSRANLKYFCKRILDKIDEEIERVGLLEFTDQSIQETAQMYRLCLQLYRDHIRNRITFIDEKLHID